MSYCSKCGKPIAESSSYCSHCGEKVGNIQNNIKTQFMLLKTKNFVWAGAIFLIVLLAIIIHSPQIIRSLHNSSFTTVNLIEVPDSDNLVKIILKYDKGDPEYLKDFSVATFDVNNDGKDDILYTDAGIQGSCGYGRRIS